MQGMCNLDGTVDWMPVSTGTICTCQSGQCEIVASDTSMPGDGSSSTAAVPGSSPTGTEPASSSSASSPIASATPHKARPVPTGHSGKPSHHSHSGNSSALAQSSQTSKPTHASSASASSSSSPSPTGSAPSGGVAYKLYSGDGSTADGWPSQSDWLSFDALWQGYSKEIGANCMTAFQVPNNTPEETANIKKALMSNSQQANIPPEFALAIMMQESLGCAHVQTTNFGVSNPGLFQSHDGKGTCFNTPTCSDSEINQMCQDGIQGTSAGPGLEQLVKQAGSSGAETFYRAARMYNSGSIPTDGDLGAPGAMRCYCSDIANRLTGWFSGPSTCSLD